MKDIADAMGDSLNHKICYENGIRKLINYSMMNSIDKKSTKQWL